MAAAGAEVVRTPADDRMAAARSSAPTEIAALHAGRLGSLASSPTPSIPAPTTRRPAPRSPSRSAAASTRGSPASGRPGRSSASRGISASGTPGSSASPSSREGSILDRRRARPARGRGHRPLADLADPRPQPHRRDRHGRRRAVLRDLPRRSPARRASSSAAPPAPPPPPRSQIAQRLGPGKTVVTLFPDGAERYPDQGIFESVES